MVKPGTSRRWKNKKTENPEKEKTAGRPETPEETVKLVIQLATKKERRNREYMLKRSEE